MPASSRMRRVSVLRERTETKLVSISSLALVRMNRPANEEALEREEIKMAQTSKGVEDRQKQIIDAALRVFAEKGFARATNRDIAREAGITTGLIYYYFKSKEDLLKVALDERSPLQVATHLPQELLQQPPEVFLPLLMIRLLEVVENDSFVEMIRVILPEMLYGSASVSPITLGFFQRLVDFVSNYLQIQMDKGTVRAELDLHATAQAMVSSLIGMVLRRQIIRDPSVLQYSHEEIAQTLLQTFGHGIQSRSLFHRQMNESINQMKMEP